MSSAANYSNFSNRRRVSAEAEYKLGSRANTEAKPARGKSKNRDRPRCVVYLGVDWRRPEKSFGTVLERFPTCRQRTRACARARAGESRSKARWYGLHIRLHLNVGAAQLQAGTRCVDDAKLLSCRVLISASRIARDRSAISDDRGSSELEIEAPLRRIPLIPGSPRVPSAVNASLSRSLSRFSMERSRYRDVITSIRLEFPAVSARQSRLFIATLCSGGR